MLVESDVDNVRITGIQKIMLPAQDTVLFSKFVLLSITIILFNEIYMAPTTFRIFILEHVAGCAPSSLSYSPS